MYFILALQLTAARLVIDHTVQQITGHEGAGDKPQVRVQPPSLRHPPGIFELYSCLRAPRRSRLAIWLQRRRVQTPALCCLDAGILCRQWVTPERLLLLSLFVLQVVCQGQATVVFLDAAYKPIRVPASVKEALTQLHQEYKAGIAQS